MSRREFLEMNEQICHCTKCLIFAIVFMYTLPLRCWLPSEKGVIFAFIGPMVAILVVSTAIDIPSIIIM